MRKKDNDREGREEDTERNERERINRMRGK